MFASPLSLDSTIIPDLSCPFRAALNPHVEQVETNAIGWGRRVGLLTESHVRQQVEAARASWLLGWAYPDASADALQIIADWNLWLLLWDDLCDGPELSYEPKRLAAAHGRFLDILHGAPLAIEDGPLEYGLYDLRLRLQQRANRAWIRQFLGSVREVFDGWVWQAANRVAGAWLDVAAYLQMRPVTGALQPYLDLSALVHGRAVPRRVRLHPLVQQLTLKANNIICWSNDLFSLGKEYQHGDRHNLVLILHQQQGGTLQAAVDRVAAWHNREVAAFLDLEAQLPTFGALRPDRDRYIALLRHWIRANMNWAAMSGRYQPQQRARCI